MKNRTKSFMSKWFVVIILLSSTVIIGADEENGKKVRLAYRSALAKSLSKNVDASMANELEESAFALREWRIGQGEDYRPQNQQEADLFQLLDFRVAQAWANAGDFKKAMMYLQRETTSYADSGGRFLANTRTPAAFAHDVFALHSDIMANTGIVTSLPGSGYKVFDVSSKDGPPVFAFVYEPVEIDEGGVVIEGVEENEQRQMIELSAPDETARYKVTDRAQVIGRRDGVGIFAQSPDGKPKLRLSGISKLIEYKGDFGVPIVQPSPVSSFELAIDRGRIEQPSNAVKVSKLNAVPEAKSAKNGSSPPTKAHLSPLAQPTAPKKAPEVKPSVTKVEPTASTPWNIIVVLILAANVLLWFLLKKRK